MTGDPDLFVYRARVERIVDGDTVDVELDLGFSVRHTVRLRLSGVDTSEVYGVPAESAEFLAGTRHSQYVHEWVADADGRAWPFYVHTEKDATGKYGRYLATIERRSDGAVLNDDLVTEFPATATE